MATATKKRATADTAPEGYELRHVDPRTLVDHPANQRSEADRVRLAESIAVLGVLEPPLVYELEDGRLGLIAGECRKYSAIKAGAATIPVYVRADLGPAERLAGVLVENRERTALKPTVEAAIVQRLAGMEGVTRRDVTTLTGIKSRELRGLLAVSGSEVATAVGERHDLTLDQLVVLAEFEGNRDAVKALTAAAVKSPGEWPHVVATLRRERDERAAYDAAVQAASEAGVQLIELEHGYWLPGGAAWLSDLPAPEGRRAMTPAAHRSCPGHGAAVIESDDGYELAYLCLDPIEAGHVTAPGPGEAPADGAGAVAKPGGMTDQQKVERKQVIANNRAWETATPVRREYLAGCLARRTVPKGTLRYVTEVVLSFPRFVGQADDADVAIVLGKKTTGNAWQRPTAERLVADATDARLPLALLAQVAAAFEREFGYRQGWRHPDDRLVGYLRFLATTGYGLSEIEREVAGLDEPEAAGEPATDAA